MTATKPLPVHGADASHFNTIDIRSAKAHGLGWLSLKATQGTGYVDDTYLARRDLCRSIHLPPGAYHFGETLSTPEAQARHFLDVAGIQPGDFRPMLDVEDDPNRGSFFSRMSVAARTDWVGRFVAVVKKEVGVVPFIYTPFDLDGTFGCPLWVARYSNDNAMPRIPRPWKTHTIRQFSNGEFGVPHSFPGLPKTDLNCWNGDPARLLRVFTVPEKATPKPPAPAPAPKPIRGTVLNGRRVGFSTPMPGGTVRHHETPAAGDTQSAIERTPRGHCLDWNMQVIILIINGETVRIPVSGHWMNIRMNGFTHTTIGGRLRPLTAREKTLTMQQWVDRHGRSVHALNSLRKRGGGSKKKPIDDYPMTWEQAVRYAAKHAIVLTPELKSRLFRMPDVAAHMVQVCKRYDYPLWSMSLLSMKFAKEKCAAIVRAGGQYALIFGKFRHLARGTNKVKGWAVKPTQIWGPASARQWLRS